jgi:Cd2+/Zn2+-exporting ATPase
MIFAFAVKAIVLAMGAGWIGYQLGGCFADVGVALLAILSDVRIQRIKFNFCGEGMKSLYCVYT